MCEYNDHKCKSRTNRKIKLFPRESENVIRKEE